MVEREKVPAKDKDKLIKFVTDLAGNHFLKVEEEFAAGYYRLNLAEAERRQAKHDIRTVEDIVVELLRNSRDAQAKHIFLATHKDTSGLREITVIDDGEGIPEAAHQIVFEPRVTSKVDQVIEDRYGVHGRGMALFAIKNQAEKAFIVKSQKGLGTVIKVLVATSKINEKSDQSTWPTLKKKSANTAPVVSGPHNILRTVTEFVLEHPWLKVYVGSPAEILALAFSYYNDLPIFAVFNNNRQAGELKQLAKEWLGFNLSLRHIQRLLSETKQLTSVNERINKSLQSSTLKRRKERAPKIIAEDDLQLLVQNILESTKEVRDKYFLQLRSGPKVTVSNSTIKIEIPIVQDDSW